MPFANPGSVEQRLAFLESVIEHLPVGIIITKIHHLIVGGARKSARGGQVIG